MCAKRPDESPAFLLVIRTPRACLIASQRRESLKSVWRDAERGGRDDRAPQTHSNDRIEKKMRPTQMWPARAPATTRGGACAPRKVANPRHGRGFAGNAARLDDSTAGVFNPPMRKFIGILSCAILLAGCASPNPRPPSPARQNRPPPRPSSPRIFGPSEKSPGSTPTASLSSSVFPRARCPSPTSFSMSIATA